MAGWDRGDDPMYAATTEVVRAVLRLSGTGQVTANSNGPPPAVLLAAVRDVGTRLRDLCALVDILVEAFPQHARRYYYYN